jgi:hypothetical protein
MAEYFAPPQPGDVKIIAIMPTNRLMIEALGVIREFCLSIS